MLYYLSKITLTTLIILSTAELAKRSSFAGAVLASIPLISVLALFWLYIDTKEIEKVSELSSSIFWLVLPSLALFISLPLLLKQGLNFYFSISLSIIITIFCYGLMIAILKYYDVKI